MVRQLGLGLGLVTLLACGGRTASGGVAGDDAGAAVVACTAEVSANCARFEACDANSLSSQYGDVATCEARRQVSCLGGLAAKATAATPSGVAACATATASESCETLLWGDPAAAECIASAGPGALGSACSYDAQCASAFCGIVLGAACGTCQAAPTTGSSCAALVSCGPRLRCYGGTCTTAATSGEACGAQKPCSTGLGCVMPAGGSTGICRAEATTAGAACVPRNGSPAGAGCDPTQRLHCVIENGNPGTCQGIPTATAGQPCNTSDVGYAVCVDGSACITAPDGTQTCVARAADNAACNTVFGPQCSPLSRCVGEGIDGGASGTCIVPGTASCP